MADLLGRQVTGKVGQFSVSEVGQFYISANTDTKTGPKRFASWANNLKGCGLTTTSGHLKGAAAEAFTFLKDPGFDYIDTSPLEREMRELNRRADIGARWSTKGLENVLKVLFHQRLNLTPKGQT